MTSEYKRGDRVRIKVNVEGANFRRHTGTVTEVLDDNWPIEVFVDGKYEDCRYWPKQIEPLAPEDDIRLQHAVLADPRERLTEGSEALLAHDVINLHTGRKVGFIYRREGEPESWWIEPYVVSGPFATLDEAFRCLIPLIRKDALPKEAKQR